MLRIYDILVRIRIWIRGSMPLTNGSKFESGSESCYFHHWPSRRQHKTNLKKCFSAYYFLKIHLHRFSKIKSQKMSQNNRNQGFSYYFCLMIEGSGSGSRSIPLTNGSGSRRPKNLWIRWIRNTDKMGERDCLAPPREADMERRPPLPRSKCPPVPDRWNWPEKKES